MLTSKKKGEIKMNLKKNTFSTIYFLLFRALRERVKKGVLYVYYSNLLLEKGVTQKYFIHI